MSARRYEVKEASPPRLHKPPGYMGGNNTYVTHVIWDTYTNEEYMPFCSEHAAISHCLGFNLRHEREAGRVEDIL